MRNIFFFTSLLLLTKTCYGGGDSLNIKFRNSIGVEFYRALETPDENSNSLKEVLFFFSNNYPNGGQVEGERKVTSFAFGLSYDYEFRSHLLIRARAGYSIYDYLESERIKFDTLIFNTGLPFFPSLTSSTIYESSYSAKLNKINLFIGFGKRFYVARKFSMDAGLEIGAIRELQGVTTFRTYEEQSLSNVPFNSNENINTITTEAGNMMGIGPFFKPTYHPIPRLSISFEAQMFFLGRFGERQTRKEETSNNRAIINATGVLTSNSSARTYTVNSEESRWNWAMFSPLLRVSFRF